MCRGRCRADAYSVHAVRARSFAVGVGVIVIACRGVTQATESATALAFRSMYEATRVCRVAKALQPQVALQFGDARPVFHIAVEIGRVYAAVSAAVPQ